MLSMRDALHSLLISITTSSSPGTFLRLGLIFFNIPRSLAIAYLYSILLSSVSICKWLNFWAYFSNSSSFSQCSHHTKKFGFLHNYLLSLTLFFLLLRLLFRKTCPTTCTTSKLNPFHKKFETMNVSAFQDYLNVIHIIYIILFKSLLFRKNKTVTFLKTKETFLIKVTHVGMSNFKPPYISEIK